MTDKPKVTATEVWAFLTPEQHDLVLSGFRLTIADYLHRGGALEDVPAPSREAYEQIQRTWDKA